MADNRELCGEAMSTTTENVNMTLNMIDALMGKQDVREKNEQAVNLHRPIKRFKRRRERKKKLQALTDEDKSALRKASAECSTSKMMEGYLRQGEGCEESDETADDDTDEDEHDSDDNDNDLDESNEQSNRKRKSTGSGEERAKNFRTKHDPSN
jgi:hypothetical protein